MDKVREAITWSGSGATLSMFFVARSEESEPPSIDWAHGDIRPRSVRVYRLDDVAGTLNGCSVFEFDASFADAPKGLEFYLESCLKSAMKADALAAWFGFEGSFDFEFLLTSDIAPQIYALADNVGIEIACGDELESERWKTRCVAAKRRIMYADSIIYRD